MKSLSAHNAKRKRERIPVLYGDFGIPVFLAGFGVPARLRRLAPDFVQWIGSDDESLQEPPLPPSVFSPAPAGNTVRSDLELCPAEARPVLSKRTRGLNTRSGR